jgi:hypothetical protein
MMFRHENNIASGCKAKYFYSSIFQRIVRYLLISSLYLKREIILDMIFESGLFGRRTLQAKIVE